MPRVLSFVLAGGSGSRLMPLTEHDAKPAIRFAGRYRLVDFVISNLLNSGLRKIAVLTQFKSHRLNVHLIKWGIAESPIGWYIDLEPAQQRMGPRWEFGTADAVYQNLNLIAAERPEYVAVFAADHVYKMDVRQMLREHVASGAPVTVAATRVPRGQASGFGIIDAGADGVIREFLEKPAHPPGLPDDPGMALASMGNYVFTASALWNAVVADARDPDSAHDLARNVMPRLVERGEARVYDFASNDVPGEGPGPNYWRDVGTLDSFYDAHMELLNVRPPMDLHNLEWPIMSSVSSELPAFFAEDGCATQSIVSSGVVCRGRVHRSVIGPMARIDTGAHIENSIILDRVQVHAGAYVKDAILAPDVIIEPGIVVDNRLHLDGRYRRGTVSDGGIIVLAAQVRVGRER